MDNLDTNTTSRIKALGARHAVFGVSEEAFDAVGEALLWTLADTLKQDWNASKLQAWLQVYKALSGIMIESLKSKSLVKHESKILKKENEYGVSSFDDTETEDKDKKICNIL